MASKGKTGYVIAGMGLGIALGAVLGVFALAPVTNGNSIVSGSSKNAQLDAELQSSRLLDGGAEAFGNNQAFSAVRGILDNQSVMVFATADVTDEQRSSITDLLRESGATVTGQLILNDKFTDAGSSDRLKTVVTNVLPAGGKLSTENVNPGYQAGQVIGSALLVNDQNKPLSEPSDKDLVLSTLRKEGFISIPDIQEINPAASVVILTGNGEATHDQSGFAARVLADFTSAISQPAQSTVIGSWSNPAEETDVLTILRTEGGKSYSTIDNLYQAAGRVTVIRAVSIGLDDQSGAWGYGKGVQGPFIPLS